MSSFLKSFRFKGGKGASEDIPPPQLVETATVSSEAGLVLHNQIHFLQLITTGVAVDEHGNFFTTYNVEATLNGQRLLLPRRYQQFVDLNNAILSLPQSQRPKTKEMPHLTGKKYLSMNQEVIEKRLRKLNIYLREVTALVASFPRVGDALQVFFLLQDAGSAEPAHHGPEDDSSGDEENHTRQAAARPIPSEHPHPALVLDTVTATETVFSTSPQHALDMHSHKTATMHVLPSNTSLSNTASSLSSSSSSSGSSSSPQALKQPQQTSSTVMDAKCMACGRSKEGQQRQTSSSSSDAFCSPQCERFYNALLSNNMTLKSGQIIQAGAAQPTQPKQPSSQIAGTDGTDATLVDPSESDSHSRRKESEPASSIGGRDDAANDDKESTHHKSISSPISSGEEGGSSSSNEGGRISSTRFRLAVKEQRSISDMLLGPLRKMGSSSSNTTSSSSSSKAASAPLLPSP